MLRGKKHLANFTAQIKDAENSQEQLVFPKHRRRRTDTPVHRRTTEFGIHFHIKVYD
jgi:hypothetical protein